jgi:hypothetical protein
MTVIWVACAAALAVALVCLALAWLLRREDTRWRRFRQAQGEPEVVARRVAARPGRPGSIPLRLMVFRSDADRWEPAAGLRRPQSLSIDQEASRRDARRPRASAPPRSWRANVL